MNRERSHLFPCPDDFHCFPIYPKAVPLLYFCLLLLFLPLLLPTNGQAAKATQAKEIAGKVAEKTFGETSGKPSRGASGKASGELMEESPASQEQDESPAFSVYSIENIPNVHIKDAGQYVSNPDGIISADDTLAINRICSGLEKDFGVEIAVVAVHNIGEADSREFATDLYNYWGIGKKGVDNGLLVLLVLAPPNRSIVFETGYGLEGIMPDAIAFRLQQRFMIPALAEGQYSLGMRQGMEAVKHFLESSELERQSMLAPESDPESMEDIVSLIIFLIFYGIIFSFAYISRQKKKCPRCGKRTFRLIKSQTIIQPTFTAPGLVREWRECSNCGHSDQQDRNLPRLRKGATMGGSMGGMIGGMGGFGGGRSMGGSWGGGRSGGGGARSRF